jgi:hypothetical protein
MAVNAAQITEGHYQGSAEVIVECDEADGTVIVVYKYVNDVATQVGTATLGNDTGLGSGMSRVPLSVNIAIGNQLVAYVVEQYRQGGDPRFVYELGNGYKTGWRSPDVVYEGDITISYDEYTQETNGQEIASIYAPESTINNTVNRCGDAPKQFVDASLTIQYTTADLGSGPVNAVTVTAGGFNNAIGSPRFKWDGGAFEQVYQKTYVIAQNGAHTVEIFPETLNYQSKLINFNINVAAGTPTPAVGDINAAAYEINPVSNRSVTLLAYSTRQLESRIVGLDTGLFVAMNGQTGRKWLQPAPFQNVPNGTYNGEIRVQGTTTAFPVVVIVDF